MNHSNKETVDCFLMFTKSTMRHWIFRFLDAEIQHVYAIFRSPGGQFWTVINPSQSFVSVENFTADDFLHPRCYDPNAVVVPVRVEIDNNKRMHGFSFLSCVSVVKVLLGIKKRSILTPYQLYKHVTEG